MSAISHAYQRLQTNLDLLNQQSGLTNPTKLLAASKNQSSEKIIELLECGHRLFGENRVQETSQKWPALKTRYPDCQVHLIGPLQTNKVREAVFLFDMIETLDRPKLATELARQFAKNQRSIPLLIQVNTGEEPQKSGVTPAALSEFIAFCYSLTLPIKGLMCVPPAASDPAPHFALLQQLQRHHGLSTLSMGMSDDYACAVKYGSSWIRIGSALFGQR